MLVENQTKPYTILPSVYDQFMHHVNYKAWLEYVLVMCIKFDHVPKDILECACGTGTIMNDLLMQKYNVYGLDLSMEMLRLAKDKMSCVSKNANNTYQENDTENIVDPVPESSKNYIESRLINANLTNLPFVSRFDTIFCLYDSVNYLTNEQDLILGLTSLYNALKPGGVLIFDIVTEYNSILYFLEDTYEEDFGNYKCICTSKYDKINKIQHTNFKMINIETGDINNEDHTQQIYLQEEVYNIISKMDPERIRMYKDFTYGLTDEKTERVHFYVEK